MGGGCHAVLHFALTDGGTLDRPASVVARFVFGSSLGRRAAETRVEAEGVVVV